MIRVLMVGLVVMLVGCGKTECDPIEKRDGMTPLEVRVRALESENLKRENNAVAKEIKAKLKIDVSTFGNDVSTFGNEECLYISGPSVSVEYIFCKGRLSESILFRVGR